MNSLGYNKNLKFRFIIITLIMGVAIMLSPFKVKALEDVGVNPTLTLAYSNSEGSKIMSYASKVNDYTENLGAIELIYFRDNGDGTGEFSINFMRYRVLEQDIKSNIMKYALESIKNSDMSTSIKNKIYNFIQSQDESTAALVRQLSDDVNADFAKAYMMFKPFSGGLGTILGCFSIVIFIALAFMILVDLSYIAIPFIRNFLTPDNANGKPKLVSNEAWYAVKEVDSSNDTHKDVLALYLKKKSIQFIMLGICILYLLSGQIYTLIGNLMDMFRGILG